MGLAACLSRNSIDLRAGFADVHAADVEECHQYPRTPELLQRASVQKLQNAGVVGLRCIPSGATKASNLETGWLVDDAILMFESDFEHTSQSGTCCCGRRAQT